MVGYGWIISLLLATSPRTWTFPSVSTGGRYYKYKLATASSGINDNSRYDRYQTVGEALAPLTAVMERTYKYGGADDKLGGLALHDFDQILESIAIFKEIFGDLDIPIKFEVPGQDLWPSHLHGLRLGKRLEKLLSSPDFFELHPDKVNELKKIGLQPSSKSLVDEWSMLCQSLRVYKQIYGDVRVPSKFVIPDEHPWPRLSRNMKLGARIASIRSAGRYVKDHPERKVDLDELGFEWRLRDHTHRQQVEEDNFDNVYDALAQYKVLVDDNLHVPSDFQVPEEDPWPKHTWGLRLGLHVESIRSRDKIVAGRVDREEKLNALGFQWEETNSRAVFAKNRFEMVYNALVVYKEIFGDLLVPQAFIVPDNSPWPEEAYGLKLGARVNAIRAQGTLISNSPERR
jgi:Helicase associated domain